MTKIESKQNASWELFKVPLNNTTVLNIFTKAWKYRWWKSYSQEKFFTIISWSVEVTVNIWDKDMKNTYASCLLEKR